MRLKWTFVLLLGAILLTKEACGQDDTQPKNKETALKSSLKQSLDCSEASVNCSSPEEEKLEDVVVTEAPHLTLASNSDTSTTQAPASSTTKPPEPPVKPTVPSMEPKTTSAPVSAASKPTTQPPSVTSPKPPVVR